MFIKFLDHDLCYGIGHAKKRLIVTFIMFFFLSIYHFWTLRIFELTDPQYLESPVTTADYFLALIGGCGKVNLISGAENDFVMPTIWFVFVLWMQFTSLYYPFAELNGIGKQLMVLSGSRGNWWLSKCVWTIINTITNYLIVFAASTIAGLCFGAKPSMQANWYVSRELYMKADDLTSSTTRNIWSVFLMTGFTMIVLALVQLILSLILKPVQSYFVLAGYLFAGAYIQSPVFFGNYAMGARNALLVSTGLTMPFGILLGMDYGLIICQANGRPIMTEHLNKRFKEVLVGLNDPTIDVDHVVFHSLRHTSTGVKLRLSKGDLKAVQGDGGWNSPDMVTKRYAHILDEDRRRLADEMEQSFYKSKTEETPDTAAPALDAEALASLLASNPELLKKALESVQLANNT